MKRMVLYLVLGIVFISLQADSASGHSFYVSPEGDDNANGRSADTPFATLERARDAIRELKKEGELDKPVLVYLRGGEHTIDSALELDPRDSGTDEFPVTYTAYENETPVLSGGRRIIGWTEWKDGIWKAQVDAVKRGDWSFRELFVNGEKRRRARMPNEGFYRVAGFPDGGREIHYHTDCQRFEYAEGHLDPEWRNLTDVEVIVYHFWTDSHLPIQSIDPETRIVTFKHKAGKVFTDDFTSDGARYIVENVFEGLDRPGEWYLDKKSGEIFMIPMPGDDLSRAEVIAPNAPAFVEMKGDAVEREFVENIRFENLTFEYTNFELPVGNSNDSQGSASVPAAIVMRGARNIAFDQCEFRFLGTFAFEIESGCSNNRFSRNWIHHIGAGGFRVNGGTQNDHPLLRTEEIEISGNQIEYFGEEYPSAVGVLIQHAEACRVVHNDIHHGWYTGVSLGWNWGYQRSISRDNVVAFNHIHHIGQGLLSDMGAIYTLGVSPGSKLQNNLIHDVNANHYGGWGIYNDEGSSHLLIENNIVYNTKFAGYNIHFCKEVTVRNNIFALGRLQQLSRSRVEPHISVFFENNIVYWREGELLDNKWRDKEYEFYFHPKNDSGVRTISNTFDMDWNLYFNPTKPLSDVDFNGLSWDEWRETGKDRHSVYADPKFVDVEAYDFRLQSDSPALALGFEPIDQSLAGPQQGVGVRGERE